MAKKGSESRLFSFLHRFFSTQFPPSHKPIPQIPPSYFSISSCAISSLLAKPRAIFTLRTSHSPPKGRCRCSIPRIGRRPHGSSWCRCALALPHDGIYGICAGGASLATDTPRHACVQGGYCCLSSRCHHPSGLSRFQSKYRGLGTKTPRCSHLLLHRPQDLGMERGTHSQNPSQCGQGALDFTL